jgi:hypothetical protein
MTYKEYTGFYKELLPDPRSCRRADKMFVDLLTKDAPADFLYIQLIYHGHNMNM